jgi:hypothetical protein
MTPNIPLLRKVVEWVEWQEQLIEGREWYQGAWYEKMDEANWCWCQTAMCVAGKVAWDEGWRPIFSEGESSAQYVVKDEMREYVEDVAADLLGIEPEVDYPNLGLTNYPLFAPGNNASDIRRIAEEIAGERL